MLKRLFIDRLQPLLSTSDRALLFTVSMVWASESGNRGPIRLPTFPCVCCSAVINRRFPHQQGQFEWVGAPLAEHPLYLLFSRHGAIDEKLRAAFNRGLDQVLKRGRHTGIPSI